MTSRFIASMTHEEVRNALDSGCDTAVVAIGATEQHGPHAPLGTDTIMSEEVGWRLAERINALVAPVIPLGFSFQHLDWAGSISLEITTAASVLVETIKCLAHHGFRRFVLFSGHGGNKPVLDLAARQAKQSLDQIQVIVFNMLPLQTGKEFQQRVEARLGAKFEGIWGAHGGEQETSAAMARDEKLVHLEKAPGHASGIEAYLEKTRNPFASVVSYNLKRYTPWGSWGDPRGASKEQGIAIFEVLACMMAENIEGRWE
ncbi:MAG: creatininase family protein [Bacillota bacterium]|nr:creatininase family protein [Bacillota bacterium]